jgi:predicted acyl esterase
VRAYATPGVVYLLGVAVSEVVIAAGDGERLAATLYRPDGDGPFPTVMEALPYRKDDITESYRPTYEKYTASGLAVLRLDIRGTGSSSGIAADEYTDDERADLRTVIAWITTQPWSNGRIGMFGTSYSGFNSLQMAAETEPVPGLDAVVATYATDDRYTDDVHYCGGVLRAIDLIDYPLYMVAMNALPPVPAVFGDGWRDEWLRRVDHTPAWLIGWLEHPTDAPSWRRGSVRLGPGGAGYERMTPATMLIVGWADGYRNNSFRVVEQYARNGLPWRMLAGPWVHQSPERARPGPNVDDDVDVLAFFHHHLGDGPPITGAPGQVFVRGPVHGEPDLELHPGRWADIDTWPPPGLHSETWRVDGSRVDSLVVRGEVGVAAWNSCGGGLPWGQPLEQSADNARSLTYDWPVAAHAELAGTARVTLRVRSDQTYGHVSVKLCDVGPDRASTLITRGMLDLRHRGCWPADHRGTVGQPPRDLDPGEWIELELEFEATTWTLEPGHTLRLAIAGTDWPNCWPPPGPVTLQVDTAAIELVLPVVELPASTHTFRPGGGVHADDGDGVTWRVEHDVLGRETRAITRYGGTYTGAHGATITDDYRGEVGVSTLSPADAWARGTSSFEISWPGVSVRTESRLSVVSNAETFDVTIDLHVSENGAEIAHRIWQRTLPRV